MTSPVSKSRAPKTAGLEDDDVSQAVLGR